MDKFAIILPNDKLKTYQLFIILMNLINVGVLILVNTKVADDSNLHLFISTIAGSSLGPILLWIFSKKYRNFIYLITTYMLFFSIAWFLLGNIIAGCSMLVLFFMALKALKKLVVVFQKNGIVYPSFPAKTIQWNETEKVQMKDGILTIDLKNNKLLQFTLNEKDNPDLDEDEFNEFVRKFK